MEFEINKPESEAELVAIFKEIFESDDPPLDLIVGIGDDAAVYEPGVDTEMKTIVTADMLVEDVHFRKRYHSYFDIGWRTAVANISDIAAMGGIPRWGLVTLAVTPDMSVNDIMEICYGLKAALDENGALIVGGDLAKSPDRMTISMTLIGESTGNILRRKSAQLGDIIAVTGNLGWSGAGLAILESDFNDLPDNVRNLVINNHKKPTPRVIAGQIFSNVNNIGAVIDISDGLGIDLARVCAASHVGCRIFEEKLPVPPEVKIVAVAMKRDYLEFATAGEDFELLVTGDESAIDTVDKALKAYKSAPKLTKIGEIIDEL
ncbi:MAG: thiamine-phosphate kinase [bacterium]|nr:thiamine-phosphate kinase [bacterium]